MGEGVAENFVPPNNENGPLFFNSLSVSPVEILNAESAGNFELEIGVYQNALNDNGVKDTSCTKLASECKRIRVAGQEWSVGDRTTGP